MDANKIETMKARELLDEDGENRAVRTFLMQYSCDRAVTVGAMLAHMNMSGWRGTAPAFAPGIRPETHLTKAGAQIWVRHLFSLESGNTSEKAGQLDHEETAETRMNSGFEGGHLGSAPAAGTVEKDVERYQLMRAQLSSCDLDYYRLEGQPQEEIDAYCDSEIAAHTKGKDAA